MKTLLRADNGSLIASRLQVADSFSTRLRGLLGKASLESDEGLLIPGCTMVHMFFMRFPIDVIFCARSMEILDIHERLRPWRLSKWVPGAWCAIELAAGTAAACRLEQGVPLDLR